SANKTAGRREELVPTSSMDLPKEAGEEGEAFSPHEMVPGKETTTGGIEAGEKTTRDIAAFAAIARDLHQAGLGDAARLLNAMISQETSTKMEPEAAESLAKALGWSRQKINKVLPVLQREIKRRRRAYSSINALMRGRVTESILALLEARPLLRLLF